MRSTRGMTTRAVFVAALVAALAAWLPTATAEARPLEIDVWTDRGDDGVVYAGEPVDVFFRTSKRARVIVYAVDADGWVHILFPTRAWEDETVRGARDYRIPGERVDALFRSPDRMVVIGAVAARNRLHADRWFDGDRTTVFCGDDSWVFPERPPYGAVIGRVVGDPFKAVWAIEDALLPPGTRDDDFAVDLCWFFTDTGGFRPRCIVVGGRPRWECDPRFHLVFNLGAGFDWPRSVIRPGVHRVCRTPSSPIPTACEVRRPPDGFKWKEIKEKNTKKEWNQTGDSCVLVSERRKKGPSVLPDGKKAGSGAKPEGTPKRSDSSGTKKKSSSTSNKAADEGYSSRKGHKGSPK